MSYTPFCPAYNRSLHLFAVGVAFCTLCLIGLGGLVTSHGVGMAVPDWPNTYGYNMFLFPFSQWVGGVFYEHTHRLLATGVGLLTTVLAMWLWLRETNGRTAWMGVLCIGMAVMLLGVRLMPVYVVLTLAGLAALAFSLWQASQTGWSLRWLGVAAFAAVVVQGVLGGLRVVWAKDEIGIFHASLAQLFLVLIAVIALMTSQFWTNKTESAKSSGLAGVGVAWNRLHLLLVGTTALIFVQLLIGATMRHQHAGLAIPDFPLAYGSLWPDTSPDAVARYNQQRIETVAQNPITAFQIVLQMLHRVTALGIVALVLACSWRIRTLLDKGDEMRRLAGVWVLLIFIQFGLGVWTLWSNKAADVASMHVVCGALSLVTGGLMCVISARLHVGSALVDAANQTNLSAFLPGNERAAAK